MAKTKEEIEKKLPEQKDARKLKLIEEIKILAEQINDLSQIQLDILNDRADPASTPGSTPENTVEVVQRAVIRVQPLADKLYLFCTELQQLQQQDDSIIAGNNSAIEKDWTFG